MLVLDRNGDGLINDGGELFGDNTVLGDGSNAEHGFAALAELDSNNDGKIDANDTRFADLRVWRDLNQDGVSQGNELFSLDAVNVVSLNLANEEVNTELKNGNSLAQKGSYSDKEGNSKQMGDLLFDNNSLYSEFADHIELNDKQKELANLKGIGRLRDLREAAVQSSALETILKAYSKCKDKGRANGIA